MLQSGHLSFDCLKFLVHWIDLEAVLHLVEAFFLLFFEAGFGLRIWLLLEDLLAIKIYLIQPSSPSRSSTKHLGPAKSLPHLRLIIPPIQVQIFPATHHCTVLCARGNPYGSYVPLLLEKLHGLVKLKRHAWLLVRDPESVFGSCYHPGLVKAKLFPLIELLFINMVVAGQTI